MSWFPRSGTPEAIAHWNRIRDKLQPVPAEWGVKRTNYDIALELARSLSAERREQLAMALLGKSAPATATE